MERVRILVFVAAVMAVMMFRPVGILAESGETLVSRDTPPSKKSYHARDSSNGPTGRFAQRQVLPGMTDTPVGGPSGPIVPAPPTRQLSGTIGVQGRERGQARSVRTYGHYYYEGNGQLTALRSSWEAAAVRYARGGMLDPRAYNAAYARYEAYRDRYYSDEGTGGRRLRNWVRRQSIYAGGTSR
jgi:hypothetical protein